MSLEEFELIVSDSAVWCVEAVHTVGATYLVVFLTGESTQFSVIA